MLNLIQVTKVTSHNPPTTNTASACSATDSLEGDDGLLGLSPPGLGGVHRLPVDPQPAADVPQPLLKHRWDHAVAHGSDVQQVVPTERHHVHHVLKEKGVVGTISDSP